MRKRAVVGLVSFAVLGSLAAVAPAATAKSAVKVPPVCVKHTLPKHLNVQVGYCP
jgi:hypothetical protein